jgi:hypothetical protein
MPDPESRTQRIRELAYLRWEEDGRQDGRHDEYWAWAEAAVANQEAAQAHESNGEQQQEQTPESLAGFNKSEPNTAESSPAKKPTRMPRAQPKPAPPALKSPPAKKDTKSAPSQPSATQPNKPGKPTKKR